MKLNAILYPIFNDRYQNNPKADDHTSFVFFVDDELKYIIVVCIFSIDL